MLLRDEQTANIVLENTGVCSAHTQNSLTHARAHSNLCWISFIFKSKKKKKKVTTENVTTFQAFIQSKPSDQRAVTESIKTPREEFL